MKVKAAEIIWTSPKVKAAEIIWTGPIGTFQVDTVELPDENIVNLAVLKHPGAAAVIPLVDNSYVDPKVLLLKQYRHAVKKFIWEIPAGKLDNNEDPEACVRRELVEETGYAAKNIKKLGCIYVSPGITDETIHLYAASGLSGGPENNNLETGELIECNIFSLSEIKDMIKRGLIIDSKTICAFYFFENLK